MSERHEAGFVIAASSPNGAVCWLTGPRLAGFRTFARRDSAEVFVTAKAAQEAIDAMTEREDCLGIVFRIKPETE